jgi:ribose 5-phosphate isomerase A
VVPFGWGAQQRFVASLGARVARREAPTGQPFHTDQGNYILDCAFGPIADAATLAARLDAQAGIVAHGLFIGLTTDLLVAAEDGISHTTRSRVTAP